MIVFLSHHTQVMLKKNYNLDEIKKFTDIANEWWNINGSFSILHKINPIRLDFIIKRIKNYLEVFKNHNDFSNVKLLDVGCGGGLLSIPMARLGMSVTSIDPGEENIAAAHSAAKAFNLTIDFKAKTTKEMLHERKRLFDVVLCIEVLEHVEDQDELLRDCISLVKPGGLIFFSTINKTIKSLFLAKYAAEYILNWVPTGTHDWQKFISPDRITNFMNALNVELIDIKGLTFNLLRNEWKLSEQKDMNYICCFKKN